MKLVCLGMPGVGKGTISKLLEEDFGIRHISTGDILRKTSQADTKHGRKIRAILNSGHLVSDDFMCELIKKEIQQNQQKFLLDGFPRTIVQAKVLQSFVDIEATLYFKAKRENVIARIENRALDSNELREDDRKEIFLKRFALFEKNIETLLSYYREKNLLQEIDANGSIADVYAETKKALGF